MATFLALWDDRLDRELGSEDTTQLFTTARRKAAINEAQQWWLTQTECLVRTEIITLADGDGEYDLEAEISDGDFLKIAKRGVALKKDPATGDDTWLAGPDLPRRSIEWLDDFEPNWRAATASTPVCWYEFVEGGTHMIGLYPAPDVPTGDAWYLHVPYVVKASDMSADGDIPFSVSSNALAHLAPWHDALAYYAASELEKLRKGTERSLMLRQQAEARVLDWLDKQRPIGGKTVTMTRSYRRERSRPAYSDYGNRWDDPNK